jgi:hypothetical protein
MTFLEQVYYCGMMDYLKSLTAASGVEFSAALQNIHLKNC